MHGAQAGLVLACALVACTGRDDAALAPSRNGEARAEPQPHPPRAPRPASSTAGLASPQAPAPAPADTGKRLDARLDGFGSLTLGMPMTAAGQAWPGLFDSLPRMAEGVCFNADPGGVALPYFSVMFDDGKFVRYDTSNDTLVAPGGGKRGMSEVRLQMLYANALQAAPHRFVKGGKYLSLDTSGVAPSRLVFETDAKGLVSEWHVGLLPYADYTEGCESDPG